MATEQDKARALFDRVEAIRAYTGTELFRHTVALLEELKAGYLLDLVDITPEQLQVKQGALRQVIALQTALTCPASGFVPLV